MGGDLDRREGSVAVNRAFREFEYYFLRLPYYSLWKPDHAYRKIRAFAKNRVNEERRRRAACHLKAAFKEQLNDEQIEALSRRYLETLYCDDLDAWLRLMMPWKKIKGYVKIEDGENFREVAKSKRGCILLSTHFGGALFIFDVVRELGGKPQVLGRPIKRDYFRGDLLRWAYLKFRFFCMERAIGERVIFTEERGTKKEVLDKLNKGYHIVVTFDVPPQFTRGKIETVRLLERQWKFPGGFLELIAGKEIPIVPFYAHLAEDHTKTFRFYPPYQIKDENEINAALQKSATIFESHLLERPEQWFFWDGAEAFW
jgi:lauroyl/myristoyl acyltransferase